MDLRKIHFGCEGTGVKMEKIKCIDATEKIISDLKYLFSEIHFERITDEHILDVNDKILICKNKRDFQLEKELLEFGLKEKSNFLYMEDFVKNLNYLTDRKIERQIVLWGAGNIAKACVDNWEKVYPSRKITYMVDNYCEENSKKQYEGIPIVPPAVIDDWKKYFIVIAVADCYAEIEKQLNEMGLERGIHYISYQVAMQDVTAQALKTIFAKPYRKKVCRAPFRIVNANLNEVYPCTCAYSMNSIGNPMLESMEEIWNSAMARIIRCSVMNGTYTFCSKTFCEVYDLNEVEMEEGKEIENWEVSYTHGMKPSTVVFSIDDTCNLRCPSCRQEVHVAGPEKVNELKKCADRLLNSICEDTSKIWLAGNGECFFSVVYRWILQDERMKKRNQVSILSNGTLFNEKAFQTYLSAYSDIDVMLSIDGVKKDTIERLRRGAKYENIVQNFAFLGMLRKQNRIRKLCVSMTLQSANIYELHDMVKWCEENNVDQLNIIKMVNYFYSDSEFDKMSVIQYDGTIKNEYADVFDNAILENPMIHWMGFPKQFKKYDIDKTFFLYNERVENEHGM